MTRWLGLLVCRFCFVFRRMLRFVSWKKSTAATATHTHTHTHAQFSLSLNLQPPPPGGLKGKSKKYIDHQRQTVQTQKLQEFVEFNWVCFGKKVGLMTRGKKNTIIDKRPKLCCCCCCCCCGRREEDVYMRVNAGFSGTTGAPASLAVCHTAHGMQHQLARQSMTLSSPRLFLARTAYQNKTTHNSNEKGGGGV